MMKYDINLYISVSKIRIDNMTALIFIDIDFSFAYELSYFIFNVVYRAG